MSDTIERELTVALQRAELLVTQDRNEDARVLIEEALFQFPDEPQLLLYRAWILIRLDRDALAIATLKAVLALAPDWLNARYLLSIAQANVGDISAGSATIRSCLDAEPENPEFHLQFANLLTSQAQGARGRRRRRALAKEHIATALELDPERASSYRVAASIYWRLDEPDDAKKFAEQGLALNPDEIGLLTVHADLAAATVASNDKYDATSVPAAQVAEMSKLLAHSPQHTLARRALFVQLWSQQMRLIDMPLVLLPIIALTVKGAFRTAGLVPLLITGAVIVVIFGGRRLLSYMRVFANASPGFRELLTHSGSLPRVRKWLTIIAWGGTVAGIVAMFFLRDPIAIRWLIVGLAGAASAALASSLLLQLSYFASAKQVGGFADDNDSLQRHADHRRYLRAHLIVRIFGMAALAALAGVLQGGREDVLPAVLIGGAGLVLTAALGIFLTRNAESRTRANLPEGTSRPEGYRVPSPVGVACNILVAGSALALIAISVVSIPVVPNVYDTASHYELIWPHGRADNSDTEEDPCFGRPANRLACIFERNRERIDNGFDIPKISIPTIEIPNINFPDN